MQHLQMPFARQMMLCGYKTEIYRKHWGYDHFGIDVSTKQGGAGGDPTIYASGDGTILTVGRDTGVGNVIVMLYPDAYNHHTGQSADLIARYMHLESIAVKAGQKVKRGDNLGVEGRWKTGTDYHLHLEFDTDTAWPCYSPQVAGANILKHGVDSCVNPSYILHRGPGQVLVEPTYAPAWLNAEDRAIPEMPGAADGTSALEANIAALEAEAANYKAAITAYEADRAAVYNLARQIIEQTK